RAASRSDATLVAGLALLVSDGEGAAANWPGGAGSDESDWIDFMIGVDDALRPRGPDASKGDSSRGALSVEQWLASVDELFRDWPPAAAGEVARGTQLLTGVALDELQSLTSALSLSVETVAGSDHSLPDLHVREIATALCRAGTAVSSGLADYI